MLHWYVFQSKPRKEPLLCEQLQLNNIDTFFPCIHVRPVNPRARKIKPYFPGYVFGRLDLEHAGRSVLDWIPGVVGIVNLGGEPATISDHLINTLRKHVETINASNRNLSKSFQTGDLVAIHEGAFAGYEAIFDARLPGRDRVEVLLKMIQGSQIRVELPVEQITLRKSSSE